MVLHISHTKYLILFLFLSSLPCNTNSKSLTKGLQNRDSTKFRVVWNSPTKDCGRHYGINLDVTQYGMAENPDDDWMGPEVSLFYKDNLGLYPAFTRDGRAVNGGLPQSGNLSEHLRRAKQDLVKYIPDLSFKGLGVIDWESWRPLWDRDYDTKAIYRHRSEAKVKAKHPDWSEEKVKEEAKMEFETAARAYMEQTLRLACAIRSRGVWGFYGFPRCYNKDGQSTCSAKVMSQNNQLLWLFNASSALYPSAYLSESMVDDFAFVHGQVLEALRLRALLPHSNKPIYMYSTYRRDEDTFYSERALNATILQAADMGIEGVVLWGASRESDSRQTCEELKVYLDQTLGPFVQNVLQESQRCSSTLCSSRGRCVLKKTLEELHNVSSPWWARLTRHLMKAWNTITSWLSGSKEEQQMPYVC